MNLVSISESRKLIRRVVMVMMTFDSEHCKQTEKLYT